MSTDSTTSAAPPRRVIGFDSWVGGAHHYQRLLEPLRSRGLALSVVHLGSWGSDPGRPREERMGELPLRDIAAYGNDLRAVLERERPAAVIFLSTDTFAHRAFNRYCRQRGVPTVNLYHGLVRVQAVDEGSPYRLNARAHLRFVTSRLLKSLTLTWPAYGGALWRTGARPAAWLRFARDVLNGGLGRFSLVSAEDARAARCCVYVPADIEHAVRKYGFRRDQVSAVGNPDLVRFGLRAESIGAQLDAPADGRDVMYIDTGLIHTGFVFNSAEEFEQHIVASARALSRHGRRLLFKPHPDHLRTGILERLEAAGVAVCDNSNFMTRLAQCCAAIAEPSSLALLPALLGMPLFLAQYGPLAGQRFGEVLTSYPRAQPLTHLEDFEAQLQRACGSCDLAAARHWIHDNTGPLPAADMPQRVAELIARMIVEAGRDRELRAPLARAHPDLAP